MIGLLDAQAGQVFLGVGGVLVVASVITGILAVRLKGRESSLVSNLKQRVGAWWIMAAILALVLMGGETVTLVFFLVLSFLALREFLTILPTSHRDHKVLVWLVFVIPPLNYYFRWDHSYGFFSVLIPVYAFLFLPARNAWAGQTEGFLQRTATIQWALMVCVYAMSYLPAILQLPAAMTTGREAAEGSPPGSGGPMGAHLLLFLVLVVQGSDVFQYIWGKTIGRHPIAPSVSPNKTVEGFLGGILTATALGAGLWWLTPFSPVAAAGLSLVCCLLGFAGGLVMSAVKRDRGIKDFGNLIAGHGGIMDRMDSLVFSAPVFFHLIRFFYT